jgi:hypothetical protein
VELLREEAAVHGAQDLIDAVPKNEPAVLD